MTGPGIELWNVPEHAPMVVSAQRVVNLVGRVRDPEATAEVLLSLRRGGPRPVAWLRPGEAPGRLARPGDFNADGLTRAEVGDGGEVRLLARGSYGERELVRRITPAAAPSDPRRFVLDLEGAEHVGTVAQVVDGRWRLGRDARGRRCLEVAAEDAGLDRVVLFGSDELATGFVVRARLCVLRWMRVPHNVGLVFWWNPHRRGDGGSLPPEWSTGLAYHASATRGLRLRVGVDVRRDAGGRKLGDHVLGETVLSPARRLVNRLARTLRPGAVVLPQLPAGVEHELELTVGAEHTALRCARAGARPRRVVAPTRADLLGRGAVGIIAHQCAVQVSSFEVAPLPEGAP